MRLTTEFLSEKHNRESFSSGNGSLDKYFQQHVNQDIKRNLARCYVLTDPYDETEVIGFYILATQSILKSDIPDKFRIIRKAPYQSLPTILIGRLAVDSKATGNGHGRFLLMDALKKAYVSSRKIAAVAVVIDPVDYSAEMFYTKYGFVKLPDNGKMFIPMSDLSKLF